MESIIALPNDYVVVDLETTGMNPRWEDILELAAIRYRDGIETDRYEQLIKPSQPIRPFISRLTGITDDMVADCPSIDAAIKDFSEFLGEDILIGHNIAGFDTIFIADAYERYLSRQLTNHCVDTLRISKKVLPNLPSYSLGAISSMLDVPYHGAHRGAADCEITHCCYQKMRSSILEKGTEEDFIALFAHKPKKIQVDKIVALSCNIDPSHPLFEKIIVFTGALAMSRAEAMQMAVNCGAILKTSVTTKTAYLVVGSQDITRVGDDGMSTKEEKAHALNASGKAHIQIISEEEFIAMVTKEGAAL